jgi:hypothetical protein
LNQQNDDLELENNASLLFVRGSFAKLVLEGQNLTELKKHMPKW